MIMFIPIGTKLAGKVDHVPNLFYVKTTFHHIYWLPVSYGTTYLIADSGGDEERADKHPIADSGRSILMGFVRSWAAVPVLFGAGTMVACMLELATEGTGSFAKGMAWSGLVGLILTWRTVPALRRSRR